jgi:hypothetical protein
MPKRCPRIAAPSELAGLAANTVRAFHHRAAPRGITAAVGAV